MNLLNFINSYPDEESCLHRLKQTRDKEGIICSRCGSKEHYWKNDRWQYECKKCKHRTTLKSGTIMHNSKLPVRYWFICIHLLTSTKRTFSAKEIQRQLGHKRYQPVWGMLHKIRIAMGHRDDGYQLAGQLELDEGFFSTLRSEEGKDEPLKRGRGSQKRTKVLVMAESEEVKNRKDKKGKPRRVGSIKMKVIEDLLAATITRQVEGSIDANSVLDTDGSTSYVNLDKVVKGHNAKVVPKGKIGTALPWVHIAIGNAKGMLRDLYHGIKPEYLQNYLNEYCYNFNRRHFGEALFERLLIAMVDEKNQFRYNRG